MKVAILVVTERNHGNAREVVAQFFAPPECPVRSRYLDYLEIIKIAGGNTNSILTEKRLAILNFFLEQGFTYEGAHLGRTTDSSMETEYILGLPQSTD